MSEVNWEIPVSLEVLEENIKNSDKVNWYRISMYQKLSEEFIQRNSEKVSWMCQVMSMNIIRNTKKYK
jgi:hypothetical protein